MEVGEEGKSRWEIPFHARNLILMDNHVRLIKNVCISYARVDACWTCDVVVCLSLTTSPFLVLWHLSLAISLWQSLSGNLLNSLTLQMELLYMSMCAPMCMCVYFY
jgi:hypothetical protein